MHKSSHLHRNFFKSNEVLGTRVRSLGPGSEMLLKEGEVTFEVPKGDVTKSSLVFYNPVMEFPRDLSIAIYKNICDKGYTFLDALSASGIRALRVAKEVGLSATANDLNPTAVKYIKKNALRNHLDLEITNSDANTLMSSQYFDLIDVDPFGTPVPFLDSAVRSARKYLSITATDTAVLCGTYPSTCWRRYLARTTRTDFLHELGVRILAGYVIRVAGRFDISTKPIFAHAQMHYYRLYFEINKGAKKVNKLMDDVEITSWMDKEIGPLWMGDLWDKKLVHGVIKEIESGNYGKQRELLKTLSRIKEECSLPPLYFDVHKICKRLRMEVPKFSQIQQKLVEKGLKSSRTHFSPTGLRATCSEHEITSILKCDIE